MKTTHLPPFHSLGDGDGQFYALAFVPGFYGSSLREYPEEVFFTLNFSPSEAFTRFSLCTVSRDGKLFSYSRGTEAIDSPEYMMMRAWREEHVPFHAWHFFPADKIEDSTFNNTASRIGFDAARTRVAHIIFGARSHAWLQSQHPVEPKFHFTGPDIQKLLLPTPEYEDLRRCIAGASGSPTQ